MFMNIAAHRDDMKLGIMSAGLILLFMITAWAVLIVNVLAYFFNG